MQTLRNIFAKRSERVEPLVITNYKLADIMLIMKRFSSVILQSLKCCVKQLTKWWTPERGLYIIDTQALKHKSYLNHKNSKEIILLSYTVSFSSSRMVH